jgi:hypothetical protein
VPWRGAREKRPEFFFIIFFVLTDNDDIILDWHCNDGSFFTSLFFMSLIFYVLLSFVFIPFSIHFFILVFSHFFVLGGSNIVCRFIQCHIVVFESDINILKFILIFHT